MVVFQNRGTLAPALPDHWEGQLDGDVYHEARQLAPGWDVRHIEQEWRVWLAREDIQPNRPERHFLKFCRSWFEKRGAP